MYTDVAQPVSSTANMFLPVLLCALAPFASTQLSSNFQSSASRPLGGSIFGGTGTGTGTSNSFTSGSGTGTSGALTVNPASTGTFTGTDTGTGNSFFNSQTGTGISSANRPVVGTGTGLGNNFANFGTGNNFATSGTGNNFATSAGTGTGVFGNTFASSSSNSFSPNAATQAGPPIFRVGACRASNVHVDTNYNTDALYNENSGYWIVSKSPQTTENVFLDWAHAQLTPASASSQQLTYQLTFYTKLQGEELKIGLQLILTDDPGRYITTATTIPSQTNQQIIFKIFYLGHSPGVWSYLYICSDQFADSGVDYRYLLNHGHPMSQQDLQTIQNIDSRNQFRGNLFTVY